MSNRIDFLDGMRGLAILMVIGYHAFSRWPALVPYGDSYQHVAIFKMGWLGVELFFLISGFVILMTLEKCDGIKTFVYRRWLRLFPGMLICSLLVFASQGFFLERPAGQVDAIHLIPGLTFMEPDILGKIFGHSFESLEGAYWSLYVEFKFYIFAAIVYFVAGRNILVLSLLAVYVMSVVSEQLVGYSQFLPLVLAHKISVVMTFEYFGWFAAGACFYIYFKERQNSWFIYGCVISAVSSIFVRHFTAYDIVGAWIISAIFALSLVSRLAQRVLVARVFLFFGFISYPLYLIHENAMIAMIIKLGKLDAGYNGLLYPILPVLVLCAVAYVIAKYGERNIKLLLVSSIAKCKLVVLKQDKAV
ncbi:acyltransferase [Teredinibacter sp. KSP-S5-2]|uniref:acyltransferase family protein n=1 Tax=Teredinibacter sp. KSP-S5-2 TaxID=3034506 RepID=UPI002934FBDF|nr:acyltransferase [Teredinibacter sp. KSP-S5-2]WNO09071.1 acyltransferase [Teredinibacter sp. KSP-S5-2]